VTRPALRWLLLFVLILPGCIRRYAAPEEQTPATTPYSALALYREIAPPVGEGDPLPKAALRLASRGSSVFADAALIDGPEHPGITETWAGALALLQIRGDQPIVVLADTEGLATICAELSSFTSRMTLALRPDDAPIYPLSARLELSEFSADRLVGVPLICPLAAPTQAEPGNE
jgi:hypothetical protein